MPTRTTHPALYHLLALGIIGLWGFTYVSIKLLYAHGLTAIDVLSLRTALAYLALVAFAPKWLFADTVFDELKIALLGLAWIPLYYGLEHLALQNAQASSVAMLMATGPLMTAIIAMAVFRQWRMHWTVVAGLCSSTTGAFLLWFDNTVLFQLGSVGLWLAVAAAFCWATYSVMLKTLSGYPMSFITRKAFGYGLLALIPFYLHQGGTDLTVLANPVVIGNLAFLALVTMSLCAVLWSRVSTVLGNRQASQYLYWVPVISAVLGLSVLGEDMSFIGLMGSVMILCGVWVAQYGIKRISSAFTLGDSEKLASGAGF